MLFGLGKSKDKDKDKRESSSGKRKKAGGPLSGLSNSAMAKKARAGDGRRSRARALTASSGGVKKLFHGVAVRSRGDSCCDAVAALGEQRFLSEDAPLLPLAQCSNPQGCRCVYVHFDERRDNLRRETDVGMPVRVHLEEKREGHGRRITDG